MSATYEEFLAGKAEVAEESGFPLVSPDDVNPLLKPHQRDAVVWAVRGGRRAIFASFGLGKTIIQLEVVRLTMQHVGPHARGLIVLPLGVRQEFVRDARMIGMEPPRFVRSHDDVGEPGLYMTNYESIRDGKLDPTGFDAVSLDEAAILRGFGGTKTFRELMRRYEGSSSFRFVATATPSPNDFIELLSYAASLRRDHDRPLLRHEARSVFYRNRAEPDLLARRCRARPRRCGQAIGADTFRPSGVA